MRFNLLCLLGFGFASTPVFAQTVTPSIIRKQVATTSEKSTGNAASEGYIVNKMNAVNETTGASGFDIVAFDSRVHGVRGTPFLVPGWAMGDVLLGTASKPVAGVFKFDVYNQQVRALRPQGDSIVLSPDKVQGFTLRPTGTDGKPVERHFERLPSVLVPEVPIAYAEDLSMGNELRLLKFQRKTILKGKADASYGSNAPVDSFDSRTQYFLRWSDGTYVPVKANRNGILEAVAKRQPALAATEMQDKAKARTDAELGAVVQRINGGMTAK